MNLHTPKTYVIALLGVLLFAVVSTNLHSDGLVASISTLELEMLDDVKPELTQKTADAELLVRKDSDTLTTEAEDFDSEIGRDSEEGLMLATSSSDREELSYFNHGARVVNGRYSANKIIYEDLWPNTDLLVTMLEHGVKEDIILKNNQAPLEFEYLVETVGLRLELEDNGGYAFINSSGEKKFYTPAPDITDAVGTHVTTGIYYTLGWGDELPVVSEEAIETETTETPTVITQEEISSNSENTSETESEDNSTETTVEEQSDSETVESGTMDSTSSPQADSADTSPETDSTTDSSSEETDEIQSEDSENTVSVEAETVENEETSSNTNLTIDGGEQETNSEPDNSESTEDIDAEHQSNQINSSYAEASEDGQENLPAGQAGQGSDEEEADASKEEEISEVVEESTTEETGNEENTATESAETTELQLETNEEEPPAETPADEQQPVTTEDDGKVARPQADVEGSNEGEDTTEEQLAFWDRFTPSFMKANILETERKIFENSDEEYEQIRQSDGSILRRYKLKLVVSSVANLTYPLDLDPSTFVQTSTEAAEQVANEAADPSSAVTSIGRNITTNDLTVLGTLTTSGTNLSIDDDLLYLDSDNDRVGIGTSSPSATLEVSGKISQIGIGDSTIIGYNAGLNTTGIENTFIGHTSGFTNTTGYRNVAVGIRTLYSNTSGYLNSAFGYQSLNANTTGYHNSAFGFGSLTDNTEGYRNSAFGRSSLANNTTGYINSAFGQMSLQSNTTGFNNLAFGSNAGNKNTDGAYNIFVGDNAGSTIADGSTSNTTGDYNIFIGSGTKALADDDQNEIVIGYNATGLGSNTAVLGNDSITKTVLKGNVGVGTTDPDEKLEVSGNIIASDPTADNHVATKSYVDAAGGGGCYSLKCSVHNAASCTPSSCGVGETDKTGTQCWRNGGAWSTQGVIGGTKFALDGSGGTTVWDGYTSGGYGAQAGWQWGYGQVEDYYVTCERWCCM